MSKWVTTTWEDLKSHISKSNYEDHDKQGGDRVDASTHNTGRIISVGGTSGVDRKSKGRRQGDRRLRDKQAN
jgi:hypothetical protein